MIWKGIVYLVLLGVSFADPFPRMESIRFPFPGPLLSGLPLGNFPLWKLPGMMSPEGISKPIPIAIDIDTTAGPTNRIKIHKVNQKEFPFGPILPQSLQGLVDVHAMGLDPRPGMQDLNNNNVVDGPASDGWFRQKKIGDEELPNTFFLEPQQQEPREDVTTGSSPPKNHVEVKIGSFVFKLDFDLYRTVEDSSFSENLTPEGAHQTLSSFGDSVSDPRSSDTSDEGDSPRTPRLRPARFGELIESVITILGSVAGRFAFETGLINHLLPL